MDVKGADIQHEAASDSTSAVVFVGLAAFLLVDRVIPDRYVLPVGFSLKLYHVAAAFAIFSLVWAYAAELRPLPRGVSGLLGVLTLFVVFTGPFINSTSLSPYEANAAELGLATAVLFGGLFIAAHYLGQRGPRAMQVIWMIIVLTAIQAAVAGWEKFSGWLLTRDTTFLKLGFMIDDPGEARSFVFGTSRIGGGSRPVATAPHPIVLSALCALAIAAVIVIYPYVRSRRRRWLFLALAPLMFGLVALETRTGILVIAVAGVAALGAVITRKTDEMIPFVFGGGIAGIASLAAFPSSARTILNQFSRLGSDPSIAARTDDLPFVYAFMAPRPLLGPGFMTHNPVLRYFDNSYLEGLIEFGVIGFGIFLLFILVITFRPALTLWRAADEDAPIMAAGFVAGISLLVGMATFDATKFAQFLPTVFILLGLALGRTDALVRVDPARSGRYAKIDETIK